MKLLSKLINTLGPSGYEDNVRALIKKEITPYVDEVKVDRMGNLIARKKGKGQKLMLAAHMDEIGAMVKAISERGFLNISRIGGIQPISLIGIRVDILRGNKKICKGVISFKELHDDMEMPEAIPKIEEVYVDVGLELEQLKNKVKIGDYVVPEANFDFLGSENIISGKALDDRIGCYILIEAAKRLKSSPLDIYFVFTVQEEIGLYGAKTSVYDINPDFAIAVDTTIAKDGSIKEHKLGHGPFLTVKDSELISNAPLNEHIKNLAKKNKIKIQLEVEDAGTTDATNIMLHKGGVPATVISVGIRNIHSTISVANLDDVKKSIELLLLILKNPPKIK
jgi:endoglucanase